jgi:hypothetical protein
MQQQTDALGGPITESTTLAGRLAVALDARDDQPLDRLRGAQPASRRDRALTLLQIHDLHRAPLQEIGERVRWQHHPAVADLKTRLEAAWIDELEAQVEERHGATDEDADVVAALRALAAHDRAPAIYRWVADAGDWDGVLGFLALEGGPDDLFDDLVATCQVGLPPGPAKMELAGNYWDEMGNGNFHDVHNILYRRFVETVGLPTVPRGQQPTEALERNALVGVVATTRALQPEMLGVLGLIELEAGPHCRYVDRGLERLGAGDEARLFYQMHAVVDPRHGQGWLENAVAPLVDRQPDWGPRILRGARWKSTVNAAFFDWAQGTLLSKDAA